MAHSSDRTLLASLGFADADKKDRRHTLACQYLCQPEVAMRLLGRIVPSALEPVPPQEPIITKSNAYPRHLDRFSWEAEFAAATIEEPIFKDRGYLVGFWDVSMSFRAKSLGWTQGKEVMEESWKYYDHDRYAWVRHDGPFDQAFDDAMPQQKRPLHIPAGDPWVPVRQRAHRSDIVSGYTFLPSVYKESLGLHIEVKARPVDPGDIARQVALYMSYSGSGETRAAVVATCYPMPAADKATLKDKRIHHVYLGDGFNEYCRQREADTAETDAGL